MYKNILRRVNFVIYLALIVGFTALQSTIFSYFPLHYLQPDLLLILSVYLGLRRELVEGAIFTIIAATMMEAASASGNHFLLTVYLYAFLIAKVLSDTIIVPDFFSSIGIVAMLTVFRKIGMLFLFGLEGRAQNALSHFLIYLVPGILVQSLLTPACFSIFKRIDMRTYKDEHSEDEYGINKGF